MNKFQKLVLVVGSIFLVGGFFVYKFDVVPDKVEQSFGGGNLPDRCEFFDQISSRSTKDVVKTASGSYLYSYRVTSTATNLRYLQILDQGVLPVTGVAREYAVPLGGTTASAQPVVTEEKFAVPMKFDNGISFVLSDAFATWSSPSQGSRNSYFVSFCYE